MTISTSRGGAPKGASSGEDKTISANPLQPQPDKDRQPKNGDPGQEDTLPWDQIQSAFAYSGPLQIEQPLPNELAHGGARDRGDNFAPPDRLPVKKTRPRKPSRNTLARSGGDFAGADDLSPDRAQRRDLIPAPQIAVPHWALVQRWPIGEPAPVVERWPIVERIGVFGLIVVALASVSVLLVSAYSESLQESVLPPSLASDDGSLPSVQANEVGSVMIDHRAADALGQLASARATSSQQPQGLAMPPGKQGFAAEKPLQSAATEPALSIPPVRGPVPPAMAAPLARAASAAPTKPPVGLTKDEISSLLKRGQNFLNEGDFATARLLFERAADAGSADAALALGSTYDPSVIKQLGAVSVSPDPDRALKWYATAADRGSSDALDRYAALMQAH